MLPTLYSPVSTTPGCDPGSWGNISSHRTIGLRKPSYCRERDVAVGLGAGGGERWDGRGKGGRREDTMAKAHLCGKDQELHVGIKEFHSLAQQP